MVAESNGKTKRINRDSLRLMADNGEYDSDSEYIIIKCRDFLLTQYLRKGFDVVIDDTNLHPKVIRDIRKVVGNLAEVEVIEFDTSLEECLKRNKNEDREHVVPEKVIRTMFKNWEYWKTLDDSIEIDTLKPVEFNADLPPAVMCDLDGTLCHFNGRGPYDYLKAGTDIIDDNVAFALQHFKSQGYVVILMSGRDSIGRKVAEEWLDRHKVEYDYLWMRTEGDRRKDSIVKVELFDAHVRDRFNVVQVFDDRDQVVDTWRALGLVCWQVAPGAF